MRSALLLPARLVFCLCAAEAGFRGGAFLWKGVYRLAHRPAGFTVYVVGESTAYGEPYAPKTAFPQIAVRLLGGAVKGEPVRLVDLALPGSDTEAQYWALFRELLLRPERNGAVLVYAGINEAYAQPAPSRLRRLAARSIILSRLLSLRRRSADPQPSLDYASRLEKLIDLAQSYGLPVVLSTLVGNVRDFSPSIEAVADSPSLYRRFLSARMLERAGRWRAAASAYEAILADPASEDDVGVRHRLAACYFRLGRYDAAREWFRRVVDRGGTKRPTGEQNRAIRRLARERSLTLVDAETLFEEASPRGLPGDELFVDAHHPNLRGDEILAEGFARQLSLRFDTPLARKGFSEVELAREFSLTKEDFIRVDASRTVWFAGETSQRRDPSDMLEKARGHLADAERRLGRGIPPLRFLLALAGHDRTGALSWIRRKDELLNDETYLGMIAHNPAFDLGLLKALRLPTESEAAGEEILRAAAAPRASTPPPGPSPRYLASKPFVDAGVALARAGDWPGAYEKLARGAELDPDNAEAQMSLCAWYVHERRLPEARSSCGRAVAAAEKTPGRYPRDFIEDCRRTRTEVDAELSGGTSRPAALPR